MQVNITCVGVRSKAHGIFRDAHGMYGRSVIYVRDQQLSATS
jgi:hypothetical protein